MIFDWYKIFNLDEFEATDLTSKNYEVVLEGLDVRNVLVTKGVGVNVTFDDVFLKIGLNDANPFIFESRAVYLDSNNDVWVGIATS